MYMVPPFLAFYGLQTNNQTLLQIAHDQCSLYRTALQDPSTKLWKHIIGGSGNQIAQDTGLWATGNGWAAAGMLRVAATIQRSGYASQMTTQVNDLTSWVTEIIQASSSRVTEAGLVRNYIDQKSSFPETSASSLLAYSAFRLSTMGVTSDYTGFANQIHSTVFGNHIASNGTLTGAVDPLSFAEQGTGSPEGQSFVLLMQAAYQEFRSAGGSDDTNPGKENAAVRMSGLLGSWAGMVFAVGVGLVTLI
jgi:rhamnogalacturonyl hydrolase YesR